MVKNGDQKVALISGIAGQDGSFLAELLVNKGYSVHGLIKQGKIEKKGYLWRLSEVVEDVKLHQADLNSEQAVEYLFEAIKPDEVYHLASDVSPYVNFDTEISSFNLNFYSCTNLLRAIKKIKPNCKFFLAGSSLMFGDVADSPQTIKSVMRPNTPYGIAKVAGHNFVQMYRDAYDVFGVTGILYNHESVRRDERFLPRKISKAVAKIKLGIENEISLGNIDVSRDWSHAKDVVKAIWLSMQTENPSDYLIGSGKTHTVKDLLNIAFSHVNLDWENFVRIDPSLFRAVDYKELCPDISETKAALGWTPEISFSTVISELVDHDLKALKTQ